MSLKLLLPGWLMFLLLLAMACDPAEGTQYFYAPDLQEGFTLVVSESPAEAARIDSLVQALIPILLSSPESRELEEWYALNDNWRQRYGNADSILYCADIAFERFIAREDLSKAAQIKNAEGRIHNKNGDYPEAIVAQQEALDLAKAAGDSVAICWSLLYLAPPYAHMRDFSTARDYVERGSDLGQRLDDPALKGVALSNLGTITGMQGDFDGALTYMEEAFEMGKTHNFSALVDAIQCNISYLYIARKEYDKAIDFFLNQVGDEGLPPSIVNTIIYLNLYEAYLGKKNYTEAEKHLEVACAMAEELNYGYGRLYCAEYRANLLEQRGRHQAALAAYQVFHNIHQEQTNLEAAQEIQALRTREKLDKKDEEIQKLNEAKQRDQEAFKRRRDWFIAAIIGLLLFIVGTYWIMRNRHRAKSAEQQRIIAETKLQVLQSQMNPHFIFNAMGGIQNYVLKSETIEAYNYLGKFAILLRMITSNSANVHIELEQEVEFIRTYLELEKLRFRDDFEYSLTVEDQLLEQQHLIPSMMIQPVVENAIIHGLSGLDRQGELQVEIKSSQHGIACKVVDNGRGRKQAAAISGPQKKKRHLSIASVNIQKRLAFLRLLGYEDAVVKVTDLYEQEEPAGTSVCIYLPFVKEQQF
ncbi:MAG: histidine kinase [Bacteroidota bacterium]